MPEGPQTFPMPRLMPLGDAALLLRFADAIDESVTTAVVAVSRAVEQARLPGVVEVVPNLISVLLRYDPLCVGYNELSAELRLVVSRAGTEPAGGAAYTVPVRFGGEDGPDVNEAAHALGMSVETFITRHNETPLRVLATGFAPGFVYCGLHPEEMRLPRRNAVRERVPAGSLLFAAGQTAITSTAIPTGWHVIGRTGFSNFDANATPPTRLRAGDLVSFEAAS